MLSVAQPWFRTRQEPGRPTQIDEPHAHLMVQANIWHLRGSGRDLVFDTGLGAGSLRAEAPALFERDPVVVLSHAHLDHAGGAYEFGSCCAGAREDTVHIAATLSGPALSRALGLGEADWAPDGVPDLLISALPSPGFDPGSYAVRPFAIGRRLAEGDLVDLGDQTLTVLELPGHTPGSIALFEERTGVLFSGDVIYDDVLLDSTEGADAGIYAASLARLAELPVAVVYPGHGDSFTGERMREIIAAYLSGLGA